MKCFFTAAFLTISLSIFGQKIKLSNVTTQDNIAASIQKIEDKTNSLTIAQVQKLPFNPNGKQLLFFPFTDISYWLKIELENTHPTQEKWVLEWDNSLGEHIDIYLPDEKGNYQINKMGALSNQKFRYFEFFPNVTFSLKKYQTKIIYIKVRSDRGFSTSVLLSTPEVYDYQYSRNLFIQGILIGLVFLRLFYILYISFFAVKESVFRKYSILQVFRSFAFLAINSILGGIFFKDVFAANLLNYAAQQIIPVFLIMVVRAILPINKLHPIVNYIFHAIVISTILFTGILLVDYDWLWMKMSVYSFIFTQLFILSLFAYAFLKKLVYDINYSIPFLLSIFSYVFVHLRIVGLVDALWVIPVAYFFFVAEVLVFGFFLGRIIIQYEKSRSAFEKQLIFNQERTDQLKELDAMKTNFFANISHEFRTPLTLILSPLVDLRKEFPKREIFQVMQRNGERLLALINQLLDLSKLEANKMTIELEKIELVYFFRTLGSSFSSLAQSRNIELVIQQNQPECWGLIDKDKTEKIVTNLLSNALKFTEESKKVSIQVDYATATREVIIKIQDEGIGISAEVLPRIFDRFYQVEDSKSRRFEGTGIGLSLVHELVKVLNGSIEVSSKEHIGTTFIVKLPIHEIPKENNDIGITATEQIFLAEKKSILINDPANEETKENILLIVDDNDDIRSYLKTIFGKEFRVIEAINGKDGLIKANEQIPDVIISDLMMPEMDGFEFCKYLKTDEKTSHIPIVMLTAKATIESRIEGLELGADDYLIKPFNSTEIQVRVKNLLDKQKRLQQYYGKNITSTKPIGNATNALDLVFLQKAKAIAEKYLSDSSFNAEQFSEGMNLSQSQLLRKLKALTNLTIVEFIRQYRLQRAATLLAQQAGTVSEIALQVGFENMSYFAKVFQEQFGVLPSDYQG